MPKKIDWDHFDTLGSGAATVLEENSSKSVMALSSGADLLAAVSPSPSFTIAPPRSPFV
jgi:hypothetical protein